MKTHLNVRSLSILALGAITSGLVACANDTEQTEADTTGEQAASITANGIQVSGCGANGLFNIASASSFAKNVDFIAIDQSDFSNLTSQLSAFNEQNQQQLVSNDASTLDASFQSLINEFTNHTTAHQESLIRLQEHQSASANTSIYETASHSDSTVITTDSWSEVESSRSGSASNRALSKNSSFNFNLAQTDLRDHAGFSNSASDFVFGGGSVGAVPIALGVATITAPFFSSASHANAYGKNSSSAHALNKNENSAFNLVATDNETSYADYSRQAQQQHTAVAEANEWSRTLQSDTSDYVSSDLYSEAAQAASQAAYQRNADSSTALSKAASHVAFQSLDQLRAKNFQLNVNMQAASNRAHTLRVFVGENDQITAMRDFLVSFPSCGY